MGNTKAYTSFNTQRERRIGETKIDGPRQSNWQMSTGMRSDPVVDRREREVFLLVTDLTTHFGFYLLGGGKEGEGELRGGAGLS